MDDALFVLLLVLLPLLALGIAIVLTYRFAARKEKEIVLWEAQIELQMWKSQHEQLIRQDAIRSSQAVTMGKMTEHFAPYFPGFVYNPKDARFIGNPVDYIVFDGLSEERSVRIIFLEVKTGDSQLNRREQCKRCSSVRQGGVERISAQHTYGDRDGMFVPWSL